MKNHKDILYLKQAYDLDGKIGRDVQIGERETTQNIYQLSNLARIIVC